MGGERYWSLKRTVIITHNSYGWGVESGWAGDEGEIKSSEDDDDKLLLTFQCMDLTTPVKDISIILTYCL